MNTFPALTLGSINSIVDLPAVSIEDNENKAGYLIIIVESLTRFRELGTSPTLGEAKFITFGQLSYFGVSADIRIIRSEDKELYNTVASENYRASWSGNIRSGELDTSRNWQSPIGFPWINHEEGYVPLTAQRAALL